MLPLCRIFSSSSRAFSSSSTSGPRSSLQILRSCSCYNRSSAEAEAAEGRRQQTEERALRCHRLRLGLQLLLQLAFLLLSLLRKTRLLLWRSSGKTEEEGTLTGGSSAKRRKERNKKRWRRRRRRPHRSRWRCLLFRRRSKIPLILLLLLLLPLCPHQRPPKSTRSSSMTFWAGSRTTTKRGARERVHESFLPFVKLAKFTFSISISERRKTELSLRFLFVRSFPRPRRCSQHEVQHARLSLSAPAARRWRRGG